MLEGLADDGGGRSRAPSSPVVARPVVRVTVGPAAPAPIVVAPPAARPVVVRLPPIVVSEVPRAAWDAKGWERRTAPRGATYTGAYEVARRGGPILRFAGRIEQRGERIDAYVADPPESIRRHPKGQCFALIEDGLFKVHWHRAPRNVDNAILYVERVLAEALSA